MGNWGYNPTYGSYFTPFIYNWFLGHCENLRVEHSSGEETKFHFICEHRWWWCQISWGDDPI